MKRNLLAMILALCLLGTSLARTEGLLPLLTDTIGKPMPSLGEALVRYPDEEITGVDGKNTQVFQNVTETDFNTFSVYLSEKGATLADYQTDGNSFSASIQLEEKTISFTYDTQTLEATVTYPKGAYDEWLDYAKTQCESAIQLLDAGKAEEAMAVLFTIPNYSGYRPVTEYLEAHPELAAAARKAKLALFCTVGGYVTFGAIEWLVLDYDAANHRVLLLSRYGLDAKPYNTEYVDITWEKSTLRKWLNREFMNTNFSKAEKKAILKTDLDGTKDKIFLLSHEEAREYLGVKRGDSSNMKSRTSPTAYALKAGAGTSNSNRTTDGAAAGWWWLRSLGDDMRSAANVDTDGSLDSTDVDNVSGCVRPALWINLESDIF